MNSLLFSLFTGAIGALLAIVLTPWAQHFFWSLTRRAEIRLTTIAEINSLWAKFLNHAILTEQGQQTSLSGRFLPQLRRGQRSDESFVFCGIFNCVREGTCDDRAWRKARRTSSRIRIGQTAGVKRLISVHGNNGELSFATTLLANPVDKPSC